MTKLLVVTALSMRLADIGIALPTHYVAMPQMRHDK